MPDEVNKKILISNVQIDDNLDVTDKVTARRIETFELVSDNFATNEINVYKRQDNSGGTIDTEGAVSIGETLDVTGQTTVTDLHATANTILDGTLLVKSDTTLGQAASPIDVNIAGNITQTDGVVSLRDTDVENLDVNQTLDVTGAARLSSTLNVADMITGQDGITVSDGGNGQMVFDNGALAVTGNETVTGTTQLNGATTIGTQQTNAPFTVNGLTYLRKDALVGIPENGKTANLRVTGTTQLDGDATLGDDLTVAHNITMGTAGSDNVLTVTGTILSTGLITGQDGISITDSGNSLAFDDNGLAITGDSVLTGNLTVEGLTYFNDDVTVYANKKITTPSLEVHTISNPDDPDPVVINGRLSVSGATEVSSLSVNPGVLSNNIIFAVNGKSVFNNDVSLDSGKSLTAGQIYASFITGTGLNDLLTISTPAEVQGALSVTNDITTSSGDVIATYGDFVASSGNVTADSGTVSGNNVTALTNLSTPLITGTNAGDGLTITATPTISGLITGNDGIIINDGNKSLTFDENNGLAIVGPSSFSENVTVASGKKVITPTVDVDTIQAQDDGTTVTVDDNLTVNGKITVSTSGTIADNDTDLVTGDTVYDKMNTNFLQTNSVTANNYTLKQFNQVTGPSGASTTVSVQKKLKAGTHITLTDADSSSYTSEVTIDTTGLAITDHAAQDTSGSPYPYGKASAQYYGHVKFDNSIGNDNRTDTTISEAGIKAFVNSSVENVAAYYITRDQAGNQFTSVNDLRTKTQVYSGGAPRWPTRNDYAIVAADEENPVYYDRGDYSTYTTTDDYIGHYVDDNGTMTLVDSTNKDSLGIICNHGTQNTMAYDKVEPTARYTYTKDGESTQQTYDPTKWQLQYRFTTQLTNAQAEAINSGITNLKVQAYDIHMGSNSAVGKPNIHVPMTTAVADGGKILTASATIGGTPVWSSIGAGLVSSSGVVKAKLAQETNATYDSESITNTQYRQYAVVPDKTNGYLSVNVPWTDQMVSQTGLADTINSEYPILVKYNASTTNGTSDTHFTKTSGKMVTINPSTGKITASGFVGDVTGTATYATKIGSATTDIGNSKTPVYVDDGIVTALGYTIETSVPSGAVFTDYDVFQGNTTDNSNRPILLGYGNTSSGDLTNVAFKSRDIYANASTGVVTATGFAGRPLLNNNTYIQMKNSSNTVYDMIGASSDNNLELNKDKMGSVRVYSGIIPDTTNAYDLGSSSKKWKDIYISGSLNGNVTGDCSGSAGSVAWSGVQNKPIITDPNGDGTGWSVTVLDTNIPSEKLVKDTLDTKVDKVLTGYRVYVTNGSGVQTTLPYAYGATDDSIALRDTDGVLTVGEPTANSHAATKLYVDTEVNTLAGQAVGSLEVSGTTITYKTTQGSVMGTITTQDTWNLMVGATASANGTSGIAPAPPSVGYNTKFLRADGTWDVPIGTTYTAGPGLTLSNTTFSESCPMYFVIPAETTATATLTATVTNFPTAYATGIIVALRMPFANSTSTTLNINSLGAKPVYYQNDTASAGTFAANSIILLVYETTTVAAGCWKAVYSLNTDVAVTQTADTTATAMPILLKTVGTSGYAGGTKYAAGVTVTPSTGTVTATTFSGNLTGNVTGNCSGTAGSTSTISVSNSGSTLSVSPGVQYFTGALLSINGPWMVETYQYGTAKIQRATNLADAGNTIVRSTSDGTTWTAWKFTYASWA